MIAVGVAVVVGLLGLGIRYGLLSVGSILAGVVAGLVLAHTPVGEPISTGVQTAATAVGDMLKAELAQVIK